MTADGASPGQARIARTASAATLKAMIFIAPPRFGQASGKRRFAAG
jgi:hypothetical protein